MDWDQRLGLGIEKWGLGTRIEDWNSDWGMGIRIRGLNSAFELRIGYWDWRFGIRTLTAFYFLHFTFFFLLFTFYVLLFTFYQLI